MGLLLSAFTVGSLYQKQCILTLKQLLQPRTVSIQNKKKNCLLCFMRAHWSVTKIYSHYIFEQEPFKKEFILMNQSSRFNAKNLIEKDFYKHMNNSDFGYDCCNNLDNCRFVPIFDELPGITCLKRYYNCFDSKVSNDLIREEIEEKYNDSLMKS